MMELILQAGISSSQSIFDALYEPVVGINAKGKITVFNEAASIFWGVQNTDQNLIAHIIRDLRLLETLQSGQSVCEEYEFDNEPVSVNKIPLKRNNEVIGAIAILKPKAINSSCKPKACDAALKNEELDAVIESLEDGIWLMDQDGNTLKVNSAYEKLTGLPAKNFIGKNVRDLLAEGFFAESCYLLVMEQKKPVSIITNIKTKNGLKTVLNTGKPIFDKHGNIWRVITQNRDITEIVNLKEEIEQAKQITSKYKKELEELKSGKYCIDGMTFYSENMIEVLNIAKKVSNVDSTVLVIGETGVGKDVISKIIHKLSNRKDGPFIKVNCGAIPDNLLESELFGYERGSFTGANREGKSGLFELADGGTIFLDEIGELPLNLQVKLLQVIEEKRVLRIGGTKSKKVDVRIITATNRDFNQMIDQGTFRKDLFYRLNVIAIMIPPLRERQEDLNFLINEFLQKANKKYGFQKKFTLKALESLLNYHWPGNVRELKNVIERSVFISEGDRIDLEHLPHQITQTNSKKSDHQEEPVSLKDALKALEKKLIENALKTYGSTRKAAKVLKVDQSTIVRKTQKYKINILAQTGDDKVKVL